MGHWDWLPMVACVVCACVWVTGCTVMGASSQSMPVPEPTVTPEVTISVRARETNTPSPTRISAVQTAVFPSPAPTATPNTYTVKENDTLIGIALQLDVSLEALVAVNPSVDPRALQIGQVLVIPSDSTPTVQINIEPPPPLPMTAPDCYPTATSALTCLGIIENNLSNPVQHLEIDVQLLGFNGEILGEQRATLEQTYILPDEIAPYRVLFNRVDYNNVAGVVAALVSGDVSDTVTNQFVPLQLSENTLNHDNGRYLFSADLFNSTEQTAQQPRIFVTLIDDERQVYGYRIWEGNAPILPGERVEADLLLLPLTLPDEAAPDDLTSIVHVEARVGSN